MGYRLYNVYLMSDIGNVNVVGQYMYDAGMFIGTDTTRELVSFNGRGRVALSDGKTAVMWQFCRTSVHPSSFTLSSTKTYLGYWSNLSNSKVWTGSFKPGAGMTVDNWLQPPTSGSFPKDAKLMDGKGEYLIIYPALETIYYNFEYRDYAGNTIWTELKLPRISFTASISAPVRTGYTFARWISDSGYSVVSIQNQTTITINSPIDTAIKASYTPTSYDIRYALFTRASTSNWTVTKPSSLPATYTIESSNKSIFDDTNYKPRYTTSASPFGSRSSTVRNWYSSRSSTTPLAALPLNGQTGSKTFYGEVWYDPGRISSTYPALTYNISVTATGGTIVSSAATYTARNSGSDQTITGTFAPANGYVFSSISTTEAKATNGSVATIVSSGNDWTLTIPIWCYGDITIHANFTAITYSITYNNNTSQGTNSNPTSYSVTSANIYLTQSGLVRYGHIFVGWYEDPDFSGEAIHIIPTGSTGDKTFYARWSREQYSLSYVNNVVDNAYPTSGFPGSNTSSYNVDDDITFSTSGISRPGWNLVGWSPERIRDEVSAKTITLNWTAIEYTITFPDEGSITNNTYRTSDLPNNTTIVRTITAPSRPGWTQGGWNQTGTNIPLTLTNTQLTLHAGTYGNAILTPIWNSISYVISFTGATIANRDYSTSDLHQQHTITIPARTGYRIASVTASGTGNVVRVVGYTAYLTIPANNYGNITVTITWTPNTYTVLFDSQGGSSIANKAATYDVALGTLSDSTRTGYTFAGWWTATSGGSQITAASTNLTSIHEAAVTIFARWNINQYSLTFINLGVQYAKLTQNFGTAIVVPASPVRTGYTFAGWSSTVPTTMPAENRTLTAQWTINQYTISFNSRSGSTVSSITQDYATTVVAPANPTRPGYSFNGWETASGALFNWPTNYTMPAYNQTLYARWSGLTYTININENGGTDVSNITYVTSETNQSVTLPTVVRNDPGKKYTFDAWEVEVQPSGGTVSTPSNAVVIPANVYGDLTVKATWTSAIRDLNLGSLRLAKDTVRLGSAVVDEIIFVNAEGQEITIFENVETEE